MGSNVANSPKPSPLYATRVAELNAMLEKNYYAGVRSLTQERPNRLLKKPRVNPYFEE